MPGDAKQCRLNAARCLKLSERAKYPARRQSLAAFGGDVGKARCRT
jgi:hypothetical protein